MKKKILKIRIILWTGLFLLCSWFFVMKIVPGGEITYSTDFKSDDFFIGKLSPNERVMGRNEVIGDPVYFSIFTPRRFDRAELEIEYKNNSEQNLIETGVLVDNKNWRYRLKPVQNKIIDELSWQWDKIEYNHQILLQRERVYENLDAFFDNLPERDKIALYNTDIDDEYTISDYVASDSRYEIDEDLRGAYEFFTYIKNEDLDFKFSFLDLNKNKSSDEIDIHLYYGGDIIESWHMEDDGIVEDSGELRKVRDLSAHLAGLPEGVYKMEIKVNDDIVTEKISSAQSKLSFVGELRFAKSDFNNIVLFSDARELSAKTIYPDSLQNLSVNDEDFEIEETYKQFSKMVKLSDIYKIEIEKSGIFLASDGVIAFEESQLFNPRFKKVDKNLDTEEVDYVLADYKVPVMMKSLQISKVDLDLSGAYREDGKYSFMLSIPGLKIDDGESIEIEKLQINFSGKSLFKKINDILK